MANDGKGGRPTECTPDLIKKVCRVIRRGNYRSVAARACGISPGLFRKWMLYGKQQPASIFGTFRNAVFEAEARTECKMVARVEEASKHTPGEARWWLAAKFPQRWSRDNERIRQLEELVDKLIAAQGTPVPPPHLAEGRTSTNGAG